MRFTTISLCLFFIAFSGQLYSQDTSAASDSVYQVVDVPPSLPGCDTLETTVKMKKCSQANLLNAVFSVLQYPQEAIKKKEGGLVVTSFVINKDGSMSDITLLKDPGLGMGEEAIRVVQMIKEQVKWIPARVDDQPVRFKYMLPVRYRIE